MDVRLTAEQRDLRDAAARLAAGLGPGSVGDLADGSRIARLERAVAGTGWRDLRADGASGVEVALVAGEFGRGLADVPFLGPVLAGDLLRHLDAGGGSGTGGGWTVAVGGRAVDARGSQRVLAVDGDRVLAGRTGTQLPGADLTRISAGTAGPLAPVGELPPGAAARWQALGLVVTAADLLGAARGAHALACGYARVRQQYGRTIGAYQAVAHPLAEGLALIEGSVSVLRHAAWAVDELSPDAAVRAAWAAKVYCARAAQDICETAVQVHGGIGNTWDCLAHVYLRRVLASAELFPAALDGIDPSAAPAPAAPRPPGAPGPDYRDSPGEAAFRERLRGWLAGRAGMFPASGDDYWRQAGDWHQALHAAGFFGLSWPREYGGQELPPVYDVILDEELARAGAPPRPSLGYLVQGLGRHGSEDLRRRFLPGMINGTERWCQGFSEPGAGSDLASLTTTATRDGGEYVIHGHKIWTSYSDVADWCLLLARTAPDAPRHKGLSAFVVPMKQPGIEQRPLRMMSGVTTEFGQVLFDGARTPAANMVGAPGEGWALAMTVVGHEREPAELGFSARYGKLVRQLAASPPAEGTARAALAWAAVQTEMLCLHVRRRLSERLDGVVHGPEGSLDKLLMTWVEQSAGHAALAVGGTRDPELLAAYLYSRAQSVMGGTSQIQKNIIASRILGLES